MLNADAKILFWISTLLLVFVLVNIFVAIILKSYQQVVDENPASNDSSQFIAMVLMQAKRTTVGAIAGNDTGGSDGHEKGYTAKNLKPTIMSKKISPIGKYLAEIFLVVVFRFETRRRSPFPACGSQEARKGINVADVVNR